VQTDETEADESPPLKAQPRHPMPAVAFRSTSAATFFVRDGNGQWFEQVRLAWIPVERPTH
jgi:hypothetical protein